MPINFHDEQNRLTYTTRTADESWLTRIKEVIDVSNKEVVDIGCGGGIYTKALVSLGASHVTGVDFSEEMLKGASLNCEGIENVAFFQGDAYDSKLPANQFDLVLERALIHHLDDLNRCFKEANRILKNDGACLVQDRTPEDCILPGDENHIRGYFFEKYPALIPKEVSRRHDSLKVRSALESNGFRIAKEVQFWETRRVYDDFETLSKDLLQRTGRSILHELSDNELDELVLFIGKKLEHIAFPIVEKDSWTLWLAIKNRL
ncbi:class I SAM-dependent methyltransferase [Paenibacillus eucommiae]|uniref:Ubiquinone/menaquinone biosynthesis C-methylase UbiE n=1 Tax=Paenibacillus eucommiae TaxID=1355755 RepID=A0ABS4INB2_9BACL|nr:class I SAM-dependent methyltransferase [Paenibacillus eucommiae]MBP1988660.1 ubiquinone/menaquinone biosynthesis C-methylase UbiE [Paenibacillus eucommiae]